jgi:hypothetical protein
MYLPLVEFVGEIGAICFHSGLGRLSFNFVQLLCALIVRFVMCRYEVRRGRVQCPCVGLCVCRVLGFCAAGAVAAV